MSKTSRLSKQRFIFRKAALISIVILVLLLIFPVFQKQPSKVAVDVKNILSSAPTSPVTLTPTPTLVVNMLTYTSVNLGLSFDYPSGGSNIQVKEVGNKIYIYDTYQTPQEGKYIEVFSKSPTDSLSQAIQKRFLQGKPETQCSVEPLDYLKNQYAVKTYEFAEIKTHVPQNIDFNSGRQAEEECSPVYATSQISYFLMDATHPEKFLFINIGQDNFSGPPSNPNLTWETTIRFIGK